MAIQKIVTSNLSSTKETIDKTVEVAAPTFGSPHTTTTTTTPTLVTKGTPTKHTTRPIAKSPIVGSEEETQLTFSDSRGSVKVLDKIQQQKSSSSDSSGDDFSGVLQ
jgi:hypothetical protein